MIRRKIGLLIINGPLPPPYGGVATYLANALPYLTRRGFEVHTIMGRSPVNPDVHQSFREAGISVYYVGSLKLTGLVRLFRHALLWMKLFLDAKLRPIEFIRNLKSIVGWMDAAEAVLKNRHIDLIHAYDSPWAQGWVAAYLSRKYKKKYIQTTFGEIVPHREELIHHDDLSEQYRTLVKYVIHQADLILAMSNHCAREMAFVDLPVERVHVNYYGVDTVRFHPRLDGGKIRERYGLETKKIVLFQGQMRLRKGPQILLDSAGEILRRVPQAVFVFVGPDDYGLVSDLKKTAHRQNVGDRVLFLPPASDRDLPLFFAACDVFVFPSCTPIECLGLSMIQAMACGKPVVGSRINGIPEVITNGVTGYLVEPSNPKHLAEKVTRLLLNRKLREDMGRKALASVRNKFNQKRVVEDVRQLYLSLNIPS